MPYRCRINDSTTIGQPFIRTIVAGSLCTATGSVGLDINPRNLALIRSRLPDRMAVEGDIENMPFGDAAFETVVCTEVLEHCCEDTLAHVIADVKRMLRPDGVFVVSVQTMRPDHVCSTYRSWPTWGC